MIGKRMRRINRYRNIAMAMISQGFGYIVEEIGLIRKLPFSKQVFPAYAVKTARSLGERVRLVLEQLGPTYIKLGQIASTRQDLIPAEIIRELENLQDNAPSFAWEQASAIVRQELGVPWEKIYRHFEPLPFAAASIGQVHQAVLHSGAKVAVKIQRPDIAAMIETDLEILYHVVGLVERRFKWAENYQVSEMVSEFAKSLRNELNYSLEARYALKIASQLTTHSRFYIPKVYEAYSTKKVLTTEFIAGIKINEIDKLTQHGFALPDLAERFVTGILHQVFIAGFFHGDPHPGNVVVLANGDIGLFDFGMTGRLGPEMRFHLASLIIAMMRRNSDGIVKAILAMGIAPDNVNLSQLRNDIDQFQEEYYDIPLSRLGLGNTFSKISAIVFKHHIKLPADLTLMGKTLITTEGIAQKLDPGLNVVSIAEPLGRELLRERLKPKHLLDTLWQNATEFTELLLGFPKYFKELSSFVKRGRLRLDVSIPEMDIFLKTEERMINRLSLCGILLSFCIIMAGLIIGLSFAGQYTVLKNPIIEIGLGVACALFMWLFYAIIRSGGL
jgi:ubiquinone biosynthesis protein